MEKSWLKLHANGSVTFLLGSWWTVIPAIFQAARALQAELPGYHEYTPKGCAIPSCRAYGDAHSFGCPTALIMI
ncbi:MAG: hypothetical protein HPY76_04515 [Anaerolineae bacterium]|nr:hypothetical protein [Anaerolineae bacterium]